MRDGNGEQKRIGVTEQHTHTSDSKHPVSTRTRPRRVSESQEPERSGTMVKVSAMHALLASMVAVVLLARPTSAQEEIKSAADFTALQSDGKHAFVKYYGAFAMPSRLSTLDGLPSLSTNN